jgi:hypothetical protein
VPHWAASVRVKVEDYAMAFDTPIFSGLLLAAQGDAPDNLSILLIPFQLELGTERFDRASNKGIAFNEVQKSATGNCS